jgi:cytoskeletal protein RodZ
VTRFFPNRLKRAARDAERGWPDYMFGGRVRTSTLVLVIAFFALWWVYDDHQQSTKANTKTTQVPATQIVPPGFVPDPNYTWVPRTRVQEPLQTTETPTPTPTTTTPPPPTTTTTPPPPFGLPPIVLPPPFGPPVTTTAPPPGETPAPPSAPAPPPPPLIPGLP